MFNCFASIKCIVHLFYSKQQYKIARILFLLLHILIFVFEKVKIKIKVIANWIIGNNVIESDSLGSPISSSRLTLVVFLPITAGGNCFYDREGPCHTND